MTIDIYTTQQRLNELAIYLEKNDNTGYAAQLRDLADAVGGGPSATQWAFVDIFRVLNPERLAVSLRNPSRIRWVELVRNVLVLLPLAFTWFGIWKAVESYYSLVSEKPFLAAQSFIYLWQSGFESRTRLTLSTVAIVDAILLVAVALFTAIVYFYHARQPKAYETVVLHQALAEAELALAMYRQPQGLVPLILQIRQSVEQMAQSLTQEGRHMVQALQQASEQLSQSFQQEADQISSILQQEYKRSCQLFEQMQREFDSLTKFTDALNRASNEILLSAQSLQQAHVLTLKELNALIKPMEALADQTKDLGPLTREVSTKLETLVNLEKQSVEKIITAVNLQDALVNQVSAAVNALNDTANTIKQVTNRLSAVAQQIANGQVDLINALANERQSQANIANVVSKATYNLDISLQQISDASVRLHGIAVDLMTIAQMLPSVLDLMRQTIHDHRDATNRIGQASSTIVNAAQAVEQLVHGLLPVLTQYTSSVGSIRTRSVPPIGGSSQ